MSDTGKYVPKVGDEVEVVLRGKVRVAQRTQVTDTTCSTDDRDVRAENMAGQDWRIVSVPVQDGAQ